MSTVSASPWDSPVVVHCVLTGKFCLRSAFITMLDQRHDSKSLMFSSIWYISLTIGLNFKQWNVTHFCNLIGKKWFYILCCELHTVSYKMHEHWVFVTIFSLATKMLNHCFFLIESKPLAHEFTNFGVSSVFRDKTVSTRPSFSPLLAFPFWKLTSFSDTRLFTSIAKVIIGAIFSQCLGFKSSVIPAS
jgi:hypothetical protein